MNALHVRTRSLCSPCRLLVTTMFLAPEASNILYILSNLSSFISFFICFINFTQQFVAQVRKNADSGKVIHTRQSRFYFADLGGSEQLSKSKVDAATKAKVTVPRLLSAYFFHRFVGFFLCFFFGKVFKYVLCI